MSMKSTKKKSKVTKNFKFKIKYDSKNSINLKIENLHKNKVLLNKLQSRLKILKSLKNFLIAKKTDLTNLIKSESLKTYDESAGEFDYALEFINYSIDLISNYKFEKTNTSKKSILLKSSGLVFAMTPYNDPLAGMTRKIGPSLASGSPLIMKTSSFCINLCHYFDQYLPKDVKKFLKFAFIKDRSLIDRIVQNKKIKLLTFTGSTNIGLKLDNIKTDHLQKKILELGGINYAVIFDNHNLDKVIDEIIVRKIKAAGQACSSINKVFVKDKIRPEFEKILKNKMENIYCGSVNTSTQPNFGPVISKNHYNFLKDKELHSLKKGKLIARSNSHSNTDNLYPLTVVSASLNDNIFDKHETFGPLLGISYFSSNNAVFKKISTCEYSLVLYVFTKDKKIIHQTRDLNFGSIGINTTKIQNPASPTGGNNLSGIGREGGQWGFEEFLTTVNYVIK